MVNADEVRYHQVSFIFCVIPTKYKPKGFNTWNKEAWPDYCSRLSLSEGRAFNQFFRQVVYDHFDHFNHNYPSWKLGDYRFEILWMTASDAAERIRFFGNREMRDWCWQYDEFERRNQDYLIFQSMYSDRTPPFPPILIDPTALFHDHHLYGTPFHLIEGTHRVSYLIRMLERGHIAPDSLHEFVLVRLNRE